MRESGHGNASKIGLETSKISLNSSSDMKGMISYKDLREMLKSTGKSRGW